MRELDDDTKRRVASDLQRFAAMRERVGPLPTLQDYEQITGADLDVQRKRALLKIAIQSHTLIGHVLDEIVKSEDHSYDVQKEIRINALWREMLVLRNILPTAIAHEKVVEGAIKGGIQRGKQQAQEKRERDDVAVVHGHASVTNIIDTLALRKDEIGDFLHVRNDLWDDLIGTLDSLHLSPKEIFDDSGNSLRIDYRDETGKLGKITYESFRTMVYTARRKVK